MKSKLAIEIWSDIMCPFCYIGKRRIESALQKFEHRNDVEIEWKSFQLNPYMKTEPGKSINEYLAEIKGWTIDHARQMNDYVTEMAAVEGLNYDFDKAVVANSFDAHRLIQYAKTRGLGDAMEERLFRGYFTEGANIADHKTLVDLAKEVGLDETTVADVLRGDQYADKVNQDIYEASQVGVRGVPFFVFNNRYGVSGAQPVDTFESALNRSWSEWKKEQSNITVIDGDNNTSCTDETCQ